MLSSLLFCLWLRFVDGSVAPQIVPFRLPDILEEGQRLGIMCSVSKGTLPMSFQWRKDNALVFPNEQMKISHDDYQESLQILGLSGQHVGNYTCFAKNAFGADQMSVEVLLKFKPLWARKDVLQRADVVVGKTVSLNCEATGHPKPTIQIYKGLYRRSVTLNC